MKTGIELIAKERWEQIFKHKRTVEQDRELNAIGQLIDAAVSLTYEAKEAPRPEDLCPLGWDLDIWKRMMNKQYKERLINCRGFDRC